MVRIDLAINAGSIRQWHADLALAVLSAGHLVSWIISNGAAPTVPSSLELLLSIERLLYGEVRRYSADKMAPDKLPRSQGGETASLMISLDATYRFPSGQSGMRLLYDGVAGEIPVFSALLAGRAPVIEVQREPEGVIIARAVPSLEGCRTVNDSFARVTSVATALLIRAVEEKGPPLVPIPPSAQPLRMGRVSADLLRGVALTALRRLYSLCCYPSHWRIGWRFVKGADVWDRCDLAGVPWHSVANPTARFLADPFPIQWQGSCYVFVEDFDQRTGKGNISFVRFDQNGPVGPPHLVLDEPWHLSYPFLIEHKGTIWMIPESSACRQVLLFRADPFPTRWVKEAVLLDDTFATDATVIPHAGRFWMLVTASREQNYSDALEVYHADDLLGPWVPHRRNPVLIDVGAARSAGNIVLRESQLWRPVQDCRGGYGSALGLARIDELTEHSYRQTVQAVLHAGAHWPGRRIHTLNRASDLECIDGSSTTFRFS